MSSLEFFTPGEGADKGMDAAALERFQERMRANAQALAALQKSEQKQKKQEDKLSAILVAFIKRNQKTDWVILITRLLEQNVPAAFILAIILLADEIVQKAVGIELTMPDLAVAAVGKIEAPAQPEAMSRALQTGHFQSEAIPLKIRISLELWSKNLWDAAVKQPYRLLTTIIDLEEKPTMTVVQLTTLVVRDFMEQQGQNQEYDATRAFAQFVLEGLLKKLRAYIKGTPELKEGAENTGNEDENMAS